MNSTIKKFPFFVFAIFSTSILLTGCYETDFDFKTVLYEDGSLSRETRINGRGAQFFKAPNGESWESKSWETRGEGTFLPNTYFHILAYGHFKPNQSIPPDYEFDIAKQREQWSAATETKLEKLGIKKPFEETIYSRNRIEVQVVPGWFSQTYIYEELFVNAGLVELLINDIEAEIKKEAAVNGVENEEIRKLAEKRLEKEILSRIQFRNELLMPGKIISHNAQAKEGDLLIWEFSLKDFEHGYSEFVLRAVSRMPRFPAMIVMILGGIIFFIFAVLIISGVREVAKRQKRRKSD